MYQLTLTREERRAFDWIGDRYPSGKWYYILIGCIPNGMPEWDDQGDITFLIPEHKAWELRELAELDTEGNHGMFPCFSNELHGKLIDWIMTIV